MIQKLLFSSLFVFSTFTAIAMDCPVDLGPDIDACEGETMVLDADTGDSSDPYLWFKNAVVTIWVFTVDGQNVFHDQRIEGAGNIEVDLSKLPSALYFIVMETQETTDVYRIVKK